MKNKKFRSDRLFKIVRLIVNIITVWTLFFGILGFARLEKINLNYLRKFRECNGPMIVCGPILDAMNENERMTYLYLKIGLGVPVIFYGGLRLYNYLFAKTDEGKKETA